MPFYPRLVHNIHFMQAGQENFRENTCARWYFDNANQADVCCDLKQQGDTRVDGKRRASHGGTSASTRYNINAIQIGIFEQEPLLDRKTKQPLRHDSDDDKGRWKRGDVRKQWVLCTKPGVVKKVAAEMARRFDAGEEEDPAYRMFQKKYFDLSPNHFMQIVDRVTQEASSRCTCCGNLDVIAFSCPECEAEIADVAADELSVEQITKYSTETTTCRSCKNAVEAVPIYQCDSCDQPEPLTWEDVAITVRKQGEGTQTAIIVEKVVPLFDFSLPDGSSPFAFVLDTNGDWVYDLDATTGKPKFREDLQHLATNQFDFHKMAEPREESEVRQWLGVTESIASRSRTTSTATEPDEVERRPAAGPGRPGAGRPGAGGTGRTPPGRAGGGGVRR